MDPAKLRVTVKGSPSAIRFNAGLFTAGPVPSEVDCVIEPLKAMTFAAATCANPQIAAAASQTQRAPIALPLSKPVFHFWLPASTLEDTIIGCQLLNRGFHLGRRATASVRLSPRQADLWIVLLARRFVTAQTCGLRTRSRLPSPHDALAETLGNGFGFGVHLQLLVDAAHVKANGVDADVQFGRRGLVVVAIHQ